MELNLSHLSLTKGLTSEDECLEVLFQCQFGHLEECPNGQCKAAARFYKVKGRKCYECGTCGHQLYPMKGTVMQGSKTPLLIWFNVLKDFVANSGGLTSTYVSKRYGVTQCTAWNILRKIRANMSVELKVKLSGVVHIDETFIGGLKKLVARTNYKGIGNKDIIFGMHESGGRIVMKYVRSKGANTLRPLINDTIAKGSVIHHDNNKSYGKMNGYIPKLVPSKKHKRFRGPSGVNNNTIEGDWSALKNNLYKHRGVSAKYLQSYCDEFCFRRQYRGTWIKENPMLALFRIVLGRYPCLLAIPGSWLYHA